MKKRSILLLAAVCILAAALAGCRTTPDIHEIKEIPANAQKVASLELTGQSGTFTDGNIAVSGNGYIILDVRLQSGSVKSVSVKDATEDKTVYTILSPKTALYDSAFNDYQAENEYKLSFIDAREITGGIDVYFLAE